MKSKTNFKETWRKVAEFIRRKNPLQTVLLIIVALMVTVFIHTFVMQPYQVDGISMQPTLQDGDKLVVAKLGKSVASLLGTDFIPKRTEIIVFNSQKADGDIKLIKRVIGLPGESIAINNGEITIYNSEHPQGKLLEDKTSQDLLPPTQELERVAVGQREVFVIGDNRAPGASSDSRNTIGNVHLGDIVGVLEFRILPLNQFKTF